LKKDAFSNSLYAFKKEITFPLMWKNKFYIEYFLALLEWRLIKKVVEKGKRFNILDNFLIKNVRRCKYWFNRLMEFVN
jgi:hypothetical protein